MDEEPLDKVQPQISVVVDEAEDENKLEDPDDVGSQLATGSFTAFSTDRNEEDLEDDVDRLSAVSDAGWDTDLEIEGMIW